MASAPQGIRPRECWWVKVDGVEVGKIRLCVVMRVEPDFVQVIYGQGSPNSKVSNVEFLAGTREANVLGARQDTYFRETNVIFVKRARFQSKAGSCMPMKFIQLEKLIEVAATGIPAEAATPSTSETSSASATVPAKTQPSNAPNEETQKGARPAK
jgi:hypothetical protein